MNQEEIDSDADHRAESLAEMRESIVDDTIHDEALFCREDVYGKHYYKDVWEKIAAEHFPECSMFKAAAQNRISTACECAPLAIARASVEKEND